MHWFKWSCFYAATKLTIDSLVFHDHSWWVLMSHRFKWSCFHTATKLIIDSLLSHEHFVASCSEGLSCFHAATRLTNVWPRRGCVRRRYAPLGAFRHSRYSGSKVISLADHIAVYPLWPLRNVSKTPGLSLRTPTPWWGKLGFIAGWKCGNLPRCVMKVTLRGQTIRERRKSFYVAGLHSGKVRNM
jgi:hypothetical protein